MKFVKEGVGKKPTVQFSGVNLQVINGSGSESDITGTGMGTGNLIIGYDETPGTQTGSHNLLLGGPSNSYTSFGGIIGGFSNKIPNSYASILGGGCPDRRGTSAAVLTG